MRYDITVHRVVKEKKAANTYIPSHTHSFFHYIYALSGVGRILVDGHSLIAEKGMLIMVPPEIIHAIYGVDEFNAFDLKFTAGEELTRKLCRIGYCVKSVTGYEDNLLKDIFNEAVLRRELSEDIINVHMLELLVRILRREKNGIFMVSPQDLTDHFLNTSNDVRQGNIKMALDYIEQNICSDIRVSQLAQMCGYSENYFSTYFKECVGCSPNKYINMKKIEMSQKLMLSTNLNITQISEQLGFESVHYFSRLFKKILGISPRIYSNRTSVNISINVQHNAHTPSGEFEIPLRTLDASENTRALQETGYLQEQKFTKAGGA